MLRFPNEVRIAAINSTVFWTTQDNKPAGIIGRFLQLLSETVKFRYKLVYPPDGQTGVKLENGSWSGIVGMVARGDADLGIGYMTSTPDRLKVVDFSDSFLEGSTAFVTNLPEPKPRSLAFAYPFDLATWMMILAVLFAVPVALGAFYAAKLGYRDRFLVVFANLLNQDLFRRYVRRSSHVVLWWMCSLVLKFSYLAVVSSFLTVPLYETPVKDFAELTKAVQGGEYEAFYIEGTAIKQNLIGAGYSYLADKALPIDRSSVYGLSTDPHNSFGLSPRGKRVAYVAVSFPLYYKYGKDFYAMKHVADDMTIPGGTMVVVSKRFCCKYQMNKAIEMILKAGLMDKGVDHELFRKWCGVGVTDPERKGSLSVSDISGAFVFLIGGHCLALLCVVWEIIENRFKKRFRLKKKSYSNRFRCRSVNNLIIQRS